LKTYKKANRQPSVTDDLGGCREFQLVCIHSNPSIVTVSSLLKTYKKANRQPFVTDEMAVAWIAVAL
jgi:hypothetical protein